MALIFTLLESSVLLASLPRIALLPAFDANVLTCKFETVALWTFHPTTTAPSPPLPGTKLLVWFLGTFIRSP